LFIHNFNKNIIIGGIAMKVLVLTGSPHLQGTTAFLDDEYCIGHE